MNGSPNGHGPTRLGVLSLTPEQRAEVLARMNMHHGWLLVTRAEFFQLRKTMTECADENKRLNKELARLMAERIARDGEESEK